MNRRELIKTTALLGLFQGVLRDVVAGTDVREMKIGACDWSIGKGSDPAAFDVARQIGLKGIQVSMGSLENNLHLREPERQEVYRKASAATGIAIASLAIGELNSIPYKSDPRTIEWVWDSVDVASNLNTGVVLLAFFGNNDLRKDDKGKKEVIRRLREVAPKAEKKGVILGIESYLSAEEHMDIIQAVGSENIRVYYDFRNSADAGYDVLKEIKWLGKEMICELHMKENGFLLGEGTLDWPKIGDTLIDMGYTGSGWMQIEWASPKGADIMESYKHNLQFLKKIFHYS